ncbi:MAG: type III-A CRISPR-associated protein Csm2 [[Clostridium] aminophilum]|uniref:type III-A CRISPR-associated protein Csm2 n=1 Tax=[Clostridium] aminophilum TaxID=1526 RepID=UPI0026E97DBF|nr:type III-A CRISPR-associated protein Csm2 [[Clostridium] aminophilum]MDD6196595.1 type III-A CRISPR-associated protein Csm2 [[Clostridium] aminophilum]
MKIINDTNYVDEAENAIKRLKNKINPKTGRPVPMVTTSKIRNLLSMSADIYNNVLILNSEKLNSELAGRIEYLRMRFVYECGREPAVKNFVLEAKILDVLKEIDGNKSNYILFNHYMEALVAFHKFYGGND